MEPVAVDEFEVSPNFSFNPLNTSLKMRDRAPAPSLAKSPINFHGLSFLY